MRNAIDKEDECILCKMEDIHHMLANVQTLAATYYIQAYLSPYTESSSFITTAIQHLSAENMVLLSLWKETRRLKLSFKLERH